MPEANVIFGSEFGAVESRFVSFVLNDCVVKITKDVISGNERFYVSDERNPKPIEMESLELAIQWCNLV